MKHISKIVALVISVIALTGMSRMQNDQPAPPVAEQKPHADHRTVKPHAPVDLDYQLPKKFAIDVPETIDFTVINRRAADDVRVRFNVDEGLILNTLDTEIDFGAAAANSRHDFQLKITPMRNGLYYINLFAGMLIDGKYQTRSFVIPVSVGEYDLQKQRKPAGVISEDAGGERVITLPALETTE